MFKFNFQFDEENDVICSNPSFEGENSKIEVIRDAEEHEFVPVCSFFHWSFIFFH